MTLNSELPFISVIIPVLNEEVYIDDLFKSLISQTYPQEKMEIIFIDGYSEDKTVHKIIENQTKYNLNVKILYNVKKSTPISLNIGIQNSKGSYIVRLDAHSQYNDEYIYTGINEMMKNEELVAVGGYLIVLPSQNTTRAKITAAIFKSFFGSGFSKYRLNKLNKSETKITDTVPYGIFRKDQLIQVGGFDEKLIRGQDIDLYYRLKKKFSGYVLIHRDMYIYYKLKANNAWELFKRQYKQGKWVFKRKEGILARHYLPLIALPLLIILILLIFNLFYILVFFYILICSFFYIIEIETLKDIYFLPYAIYTFFLNHLGFLLGVVISFFMNFKNLFKVTSYNHSS